jgi:hypothetical protein
MLAPILKNLIHEHKLCLVPLGSPYEVMNLTFDSVAVPAKHPTDKSCFVVVV